MTSSFAKTVVRFAPSPNGYLHLGHAYSAIMNGQLAAETGGRFLLRMENIDVTRCRPEFEVALLETSPGSACAGRHRCGASPTISIPMPARCGGSSGAGWSTPASARAGTSWRRWRRARAGQSTPMARHSTPAPASTWIRARRAQRFAAGERASYRLDMDRAIALVGRDLTWGEYRGGSLRFEERATPEAWATPCCRARTSRRATTSPW